MPISLVIGKSIGNNMFTLRGISYALMPSMAN
jgi:hypothetical protein